VVSPRVFKSLIETNDLLRLKFFLDCGADMECVLQWRDADQTSQSSKPVQDGGKNGLYGLLESENCTAI
jgi:hypothetical protein